MPRPPLHLKAAFAALAVCASAHAAYQLDYIFNGSFELDTNRDGRPDGWQPTAFRGAAKMAWDGAVAHSGKVSVRIEDSAHATDTAWDLNTGRWVQNKRRPAKGGAAYTLRGWIKTDLTAGAATLTFAWTGNGKWLHEDSSERVTGQTDWTEQTLTATAPDDADEVAVYLILQGGKGRAWFDDVTMVEGDTCPGNFQPVDIRAACTTGFRDEIDGDGKGGWTDQGVNDARRLPLGQQRWRGVPFGVIDPAQNGGKSCVVLKGRGREGMPASATFSVGRTCDAVYFLHGCGWAGGTGTPVGKYVVQYADGQSVEVPIRSGREVCDWWGPRDTKESVAGWRGANAENNGIGLSLFPWTNPRPGEAIDSIRLQSTAGDPVPILVAVTTADGPATVTEEPTYMSFSDTTGWYEWAFDMDNPDLGEIDLRHLLDAPAGKHGFVTVRDDGHFYFENGTRARFFGTNIGGSSCCPDKRTAEVTAERLARFGINMVRLHAPDSKWAKFIDYEKGNSRSINADAFDRYDYFVAKLKEQGLYVYFDLLDYRSFLPGDGVRDADVMGTRWEHSIKGASIFDPRMIELQKEFATQLLTHRNPYTGLRYVDEPALAVQEITNENSLFYLANAKLMLPSYLDDLRKLWNEWLLARHQNRGGLAKAWTNAKGECALLPDEDPARGTVLFPVQHLYADLSNAPYVGEKSPARMNAIQRFLYEKEVEYYDTMMAHLRSIGLKCPITGTNQDFSDASNFANARCDFLARNNYWRHPNVRSKPMQFSNDAIVKSDLLNDANIMANVASSTVAGKAIISPEFNCPWPNEWRAECLPLMACYGRLQDWDGLLFFAYHPDRQGRDALTSFGTQSDPVHWGQIPLAALVFHRGDVSVAEKTVHVGISETDCFTTRGRRTSGGNPYCLVPFLSKVRNAYFGQAYEGDADLVLSTGDMATDDYSKAKRAVPFDEWLEKEAPKGALRSDTGELTLDPDKGVFTAATPNAVIATGALGGAGKLTLGPVTIECRTPFASISVVSLDGKPITESNRLLLTAVARSENTGQALAANSPASATQTTDADTGGVLRQGRHALAEPGRTPVLAEPVEATVSITTGKQLKAVTLSPTGARNGSAQATRAAGALTVSTEGAGSPWILLVTTQ